MGEKMMAVEKENQVPDVEVTRYDITNMVYFIRNQQVMLDSDLAMLYQVETKNLNKAMKRNGQRFPKDFCFQLSKEEYDNLRFQIGTSSLEDNNYGGRRYLPYVYTEQGISMLASVLRSEVAINVSIGIMRAFVEMRRFIANNALLFDRIRNLELVTAWNTRNRPMKSWSRYLGTYPDMRKPVRRYFLKARYTMPSVCLSA